MVIPGQPGVARAVNPVSAINQTVGVPGEQQYTLQLVQPGTGKIRSFFCLICHYQRKFSFFKNVNMFFKTVVKL